MIFRLIVTRACGRCCKQYPDEVDGRAKERYRKLMKQLITRYMDDIDELGDIDTAMRAQFEQLKNQINELKLTNEKNPKP